METRRMFLGGALVAPFAAQLKAQHGDIASLLDGFQASGVSKATMASWQLAAVGTVNSLAKLPKSGDTIAALAGASQIGFAHLEELGLGKHLLKHGAQYYHNAPLDHAAWLRALGVTALNDKQFRKLHHWLSHRENVYPGWESGVALALNGLALGAKRLNNHPAAGLVASKRLQLVQQTTQTQQQQEGAVATAVASMLAAVGGALKALGGVIGEGAVAGSDAALISEGLVAASNPVFLVAAGCAIVGYIAYQSYGSPQNGGAAGSCTTSPLWPYDANLLAPGDDCFYD